MSTMKDVAREAGVSLGTVSNVLNNLPTVSKENIDKVMEAIKKLKFIPNTAARTLKTRTSKSIGLIIPDITNPYYPELARGVEDEAKKLGYNVFLCNSDRDVNKEREYINALIEKNVDGIILVKPKVTLEEIDDIEERCNVVLIDINENNELKYHVINVDDYSAALKAMNLLYEYGHRKIAYISGSQESMSSKCRMKAYVNFLEEKRIPINNLWIKEGNYDWHSGYMAALEILSGDKIPTAIFASNDLMAIGVIKAVRERKLSIPLDISVIGFDDIDMASLCTPQLTTIRQPKYEIGRLSMQTLVKKLVKSDKYEEAKGSVVILETEVILRESVGSVTNNEVH